MRNRPDSRHRLAALHATQRSGGQPAAAPNEPESSGFLDEELLDETPDEEWPDARSPGTAPQFAGWEGGRPVGDAVVGGWIPDPVDPERPAETNSRAGHRRLGRLTRRWVPQSLQGSRIDPGRRGALLLTVVAAVAALVAAIGVWRDRPEPRPVQAVSLAQVTDGSLAPIASSSGTARATHSAGSAGSAGGAGSAGSAGRSAGPPTGAVAVPSVAPIIVVSVTGAVRRPGLVRLAQGARVADAISKAGGTTALADLTGLNLAQKLTDGTSVVIGLRSGGGRSGTTGSSLSGQPTGTAGGLTGATGTSGPAGPPLDLNTADVAALDALPGVGPVTASSIVAWRDKNGPFTSVEQLQEISGIGPAKFAALAPLVRV